MIMEILLYIAGMKINISKLNPDLTIKLKNQKKGNRFYDQNKNIDYI